MFQVSDNMSFRLSKQKGYNSSPDAVNYAKDRYTLQFQKEKLLHTEPASPYNKEMQPAKWNKDKW